MLSLCNHSLKLDLGEEEKLFDVLMNTNYNYSCMRCSRVYGLPFFAKDITRETALMSLFNVKGFQIAFSGIVNNALWEQDKNRKEVIQ